MSFFRSLVVFSLCPLLLIPLFPEPAAAATGCNPSSSVCVGKPCDLVGRSMIDNDQKNIIACLKNDEGSLVWKSTVASGSWEDVPLNDTAPFDTNCAYRAFIRYTDTTYLAPPFKNDPTFEYYAAAVRPDALVYLLWGVVGQGGSYTPYDRKTEYWTASVNAASVNPSVVVQSIQKLCQ
ncbi:MAG: hypothetical protein PHS57_09475 [Alphaproteobacteria bacterium]|nr:hypothetical protein [Alphaproteobacteria bacterium]